MIDVTTNMTRDFARVNLDVLVGYYEDIERVTAILNDVCERAVEREADPHLPPAVQLRLHAQVRYATNQNRRLH